MNKAIQCHLATLLLAASLFAESAPAPTPTSSTSAAANVKLPPIGSSWTIVIEYSNMKVTPPVEGEAPQETTKPTSIESQVSLPIKIESLLGTNKVLHVKTTYTNGKKSEYFSTNNRIFQKADNSNKIVSLPALPLFPGIEWLANGATTAGIETLDGVDCYKYKISADYLRQIPWPLDTQYFAWIDVVSGYPLKAQNNEVTYKFSPIASYNQSVTLPPEYQKAADMASKQAEAYRILRKMNLR